MTHAARLPIHLVAGPSARIEAAATAYALGLRHLSFDAGALLDEDAVVSAIVRAQKDGATGFVIDGYPRTLDDAARFDDALARHSPSPEASMRVTRFVLASIATDAEIVHERSQRRSCSSSTCSARYHLGVAAPRVLDTCDLCGAKGLVLRDEDRETNVVAEIAATTATANMLACHYNDVTATSVLDHARKTHDGAEAKPADDVESVLNRMLLDMQTQLVEAKKQVAVAIADEKRLAKMREQELHLAVEWRKKTELSIKAENEELAKQSLLRAAEHDRLGAGFEVAWREQKASVDLLKNALQALNSRIEEARRRKNLLVARAKRAEAQKTIAETRTQLDESAVFETLARMEAKLREPEASAQAVYKAVSEAVSEAARAKEPPAHDEDADGE